MSKDSELKNLLKKKGIGPEGSKTFSKEDAELAFDLLTDLSLNAVTQSTLLTALLTLPPNQHEEELIKRIRQSQDKLPYELQNLLSPTEHIDFVEIIKQVIAHTDLEKETATMAMQYFFDSRVPSYLKAAFLEAERLKRETFTENLTFLQSFWENTQRETVALPVLIDICNNYDGWKRVPNYSLFTSWLLASMGYPTLIHGLETVAPKCGLTNKQIMHTAGLKTDNSLQEAIEQLQVAGWSYVDSSVFSPSIYALSEMREEMVKRPFIATYEKVLQPIQATNGNHIVIGYTHKLYKMMVAKIIQAQAQCKRAVIIKGDEGSPQLPLFKPSEYALLQDGDISEGTISPQDFGIPLSKISTQEVTSSGIIHSVKMALEGNNLTVKNQIIYNAMAYLHLLGIEKNLTYATFEEKFHKIATHLA